MKRILSALAGALLVCTLAACTPEGADEGVSNLQPDASATALLDQDTGQIVLPLSEYDVADSSADLDLLNKALYIHVGKCMIARGFGFDAAQADTGQPSDDRNFGIWFEKGARIWGWGVPPDPVSRALDADAERGGEPWAEAFSECADEASSDPEAAAFVPAPEDVTDGLAQRLATDAYRAASSDSAWGSVRGAWHKCLESAGLEPLTGENDWTSKQSQNALESGAPLEELIQLATTEAQCNNEVGLAQTAGDVVASYQAPLIEANQAALNESKNRKQALLSAARDYISQNG